MFSKIVAAFIIFAGTTLGFSQQQTHIIPTTDGNTTWTGTNTYNVPPKSIATPVAPTDVPNKAYVDTQISNGSTTAAGVTNDIQVKDVTGKLAADSGHLTSNATTHTLSDDNIAGAIAVSNGKLTGRNDLYDAFADGGLVGNNSATCAYNSGPNNNYSGCRDEGALLQSILTNNAGKHLLVKNTATPGQGRCDLYSSAALTFPSSTYLIGAAPLTYGPVVICFPSGVSGLVSAAYASNDHIEGLRIMGGDWFAGGNLATYVLPATYGGSGSNTDGLVVGGQTEVKNVTVEGFARYCIALDTVQTHGSDATSLENIFVGSCRGDGINFNGTDASVGTLNVISSQNNQLYGMRSNGFANYGNVIASANTQGNHNANGLTGVALAGTVAAMSCTAPTAIQHTGICTVTMTAANTTYAGDRVTFAGVVGDAGLNGTAFVLAAGGTGTTFTFPYNTTETIAAGGTASYNPGYRIWAAAGANGNGGNYGTVAGAQLYLSPYSESTDVGGSNVGSAFSSISINPQGTAPLDGPTITTYFSDLLLSGTDIYNALGAPALALRLSGNGDNYGGAGLVEYNETPTSLATPFSTVYSRLIGGRRAVYGNVSSWWCDMVPGYYTTNLLSSDICKADDLTNTGRNAVQGVSLFPSGFLIGDPTTTASMQYIGHGSAAPVANSWLKGDIILNNGAVTPQTTVFAWVNTVAGTPGTWQPLSFTGGNGPVAFNTPGSPAWSASNPQFNFGGGAALWADGGSQTFVFLKSASTANELLSPAQARLASGVPLCWASGNDALGFACDTWMTRSAAGVVNIGTTSSGTDGSLLLSGITLSGGTTIAKSTVYAPSITPLAVPAQSCLDQTFSVSGLVTTDDLSFPKPPSSLGTVGISIGAAYVSAANTLTLTLCNSTVASATAPAGVYRFRATH